MGLNLQRQVWEDLRDLSRHLQREAILSVRGEVSERIAATQEVTAQVAVEQDLQICHCRDACCLSGAQPGSSQRG